MTEAQVTRSEFEMLEAIREGGTSEEFRLTVRHDRGEWLVEMSYFPNSDDRKGRGTGSTLSAAWSALTALAIEANPSPPPRESNVPPHSAAGVSGSHRKR